MLRVSPNTSDLTRVPVNSELDLCRPEQALQSKLDVSSFVVDPLNCSIKYTRELHS